MTVADIKRLVKILGPEGAEAGLKAGIVTKKELLNLAEKLKAPVPMSGTKDELVVGLIQFLQPPPELKPTSELMKMNYEELVNYFNETSASSDELLRIMKELNYKVSSQDKRHLRRFVARQISETAFFSDVASSGGMYDAPRSQEPEQ